MLLDIGSLGQPVIGRKADELRSLAIHESVIPRSCYDSECDLVEGMGEQPMLKLASWLAKA
jgi:hypothetical protein